MGAGITVGVVALPLAMAFAIASGLKPEAGLFTAIIAGFLISALGGSRVQIGGPAGAFIVIVYGILERYGLANLIIATAMSGVMLFVMGLLRLGSLIRFIPVAVVIGFTNGIAVLIMVSQLKDFFGLQVKAMPADFFGILRTLNDSISSYNGEAVALAAVCLAVLAFWQLVLPRLASTLPSTKRFSIVPGSIVVLVGALVANQKKFRTFYKTSDLAAAGPSELYVLLDEHPDSINAGGFANQMVVNPGQARIIDYPASYHNRAAGISFADGHSEIRKWVDSRTVQPVKFYDMPLNVASANNRDMIWLSERTSRPVN